MKHARKDYDRIQDPAGLIPEDEPVFLLRGQDCTAADVVRHWASLQPANSDLKQIALDHAFLMDIWKKKKIADGTRRKAKVV